MDQPTIIIQGGLWSDINVQEKNMFIIEKNPASYSSF